MGSQLGQTQSFYLSDIIFRPHKVSNKVTADQSISIILGQFILHALGRSKVFRFSFAKIKRKKRHFISLEKKLIVAHKTRGYNYIHTVK